MSRINRNWGFFFSGFVGTLIKLVYFSANGDYSEESRNGCSVVKGRLCFAKFETRKIDDCLEFIRFNILHHSGKVLIFMILTSDS